MFFPGVASTHARETVVIGTGGISGVYFPVGRAICRMVNKNRQSHGIRCDVEATGASVFNVNAIRSGTFNLGIVQRDIQYHAVTGTGSEIFSRLGPNADLRILFSLQAEAFTLVARRDSGIHDVRDVVGKRLPLGDPDSGNRITLALLMREFGWKEDDFAPAEHQRPEEMALALCNNSIDAYVYVVAHPNDSIRQAAACGGRVVPVVGPEIEELVQKYPFYLPAVIPGGMYLGMDADVKTFGPRASLLTNAELPEEIAYQITKAVFGNLREFSGMHVALADLTSRSMLEGDYVPYHPGALRYFREVGLMR
jgi:TRAP transporter TAXI family solute receptor